MGRRVLMWVWVPFALEGGFLVFCDPAGRKVQKKSKRKDIIYMVMYIKDSLFRGEKSLIIKP